MSVLHNENGNDWMKIARKYSNTKVDNTDYFMANEEKTTKKTNTNKSQQITKY